MINWFTEKPGGLEFILSIDKEMRPKEKCIFRRLQENAKQNHALIVDSFWTVFHFGILGHDVPCGIELKL